MEVNGSQNSFIFFCLPQKKASQTGLEIKFGKLLLKPACYLFFLSLMNTKEDCLKNDVHATLLMLAL